MGSLLALLSERLGQEPIVHPGLYRRLRQAYFDRVSAIEYTLAHDDGLRSEGWVDADAVLVGPSRVGKTPLSMYLAVLGWKIANVPLVPEVEPPGALARLDRLRVFGLSIEPGQLVFYRKQRQGRMGGVELALGAHPIADELRSLGLPKPALMSMWMGKMRGRFEAAVRC